MKKILSKEECQTIIKNVQSQDWQRIDKSCHYDQSFYEDIELENKFESFFAKQFTKRPLMKVLKLSKGDRLPIFSGDYDKVTDGSFDRYKGTNFIIKTYLNEDFEGANLTFVKNTYEPKTGYGILQNKSNKCKISEVTNGTAYLIFCYISNFVSTNLL